MSNGQDSRTSADIKSKPASKSDEKQKVEEELTEAIGDAHDVLVRATTVFPFTLFPDTITVDRTKLTVTRRDFLQAGKVMSIRIEDILDVVANVGPIFGSMKITTRAYEPDKTMYTLKYLWRADALKIKRIVQGYLIARKEGIDCSVLTTDELAAKLDELGKVAPEEKV